MSKIDESLYSRQMYVLGRDAMEKMATSNIYVYGLNGLSLEIMKCIILGGVNSIMINIDNTKEIDNSNYYHQNQLSNIDNIIERLKSLNRNVKIDYHNVPVTKIKNSTIQNYQIMVITQHTNIHSIIKLNKLCRSNNVKYILCNTFGLFGQIFCDFGISHIVKDVDGEEPKKGMITNVEKLDGHLLLTTADVHNLYNDDEIDINGTVYKIMCKNTGTIQLDTSDDIQPQTTYRQHKSTKNITHKDLESSLQDPSFVFYDIFKPEKTHGMHALFKLICNGIDVANITDVGKMGKILDKLNITENSDRKFMAKLCSLLNGNLCSIQSVIGSIVAQEVQKACINKFMPIDQWLYFESIDSANDVVTVSHVNRCDDRYKDQVQLFGWDVQNKIEKSHIFLVGAGAIGCEHIKNMSMMGIGKITVTDMDNIEKSNLSRQFLFKPNDIGKSKSVIAAREGMSMNPYTKIIAHQNKACRDTENYYDDKFYDSVTIIANALDNVQARLYMDSQSIKYKKPMLESGTLGVKGNTQIIIPNMTETYGSTQDPGEDSIPLCTLKNFPYQIEHCIQYARELFETTFTSSIQTFTNYVHDYNNFKNLSLSELVNAKTEIMDIIDYIPKNALDCVRYGYELWMKHFNRQIIDLVSKYPINHINEQGQTFWSGTKKYPSILQFNVSNDDHVNFVVYTSKLWGYVFDIDTNIDKKKCAAVLKKYMIAKSNGVKEPNNNDDMDKDTLLKSLPDHKKYDNIKIRAIQFEKDDDNNNHIDFMTLVSNFRASNYKIDTVDKYTTKGIAGKIIPAIATTTSLVSGLVTLELYKLFRTDTTIETYRNYYINMGVPLYTFSEPAPAPNIVVNGKKFSVWDTFEFIDPTPRHIMEYFKTTYDIELESMYIDSHIIISSLIDKNKYHSRMDKKMSQIYGDIIGIPPSESFSISIIEKDDDGVNEDLLPDCIIKL